LDGDGKVVDGTRLKQRVDEGAADQEKHQAREVRVREGSYAADDPTATSQDVRGQQKQVLECMAKVPEIKIKRYANRQSMFLFNGDLNAQRKSAI
jgi:hypothetical protein